MRQFTRGYACPTGHPRSTHSKLSGSPMPFVQQVFGLSNGMTVNYPSLLFRPQQWIVPTTFPQTRRDPRATRVSFAARHQKQGTKLYCFPTSLALLADRREKVQWWSLWAPASFCHLQMFAVLVPQPRSSPRPLQPSLGCIQRSIHCYSC